MDSSDSPRDPAPSVSWERPVLSPLTGSSEAATGTSTFIVETGPDDFIYAPLPS